MCQNTTHELPDCGISEKWTNRALRKWGLKLGVGGWGVIWMDAGWTNGILSEHAVFVGFNKQLLNSNIFRHYAKQERNNIEYDMIFGLINL